jgi:carnitine O-acetyltransferase
VNAVPEWSDRTFGNEELLPRVPLPTLEATGSRFLQWCRPLLTAPQYAATEQALKEFLAGPGRPLQEALQKYDAGAGVHSWLDTFWPYRYLGRRDRIALNANFFFLFKRRPGDQIDRAVALILGALEVKRQIDTETYPPSRTRGVPTSMVQNRFLFSTTRIPGAVQDSVRSWYSPQRPGPSPARHVVVLHQGNLVRLDVLGPAGEPYAAEELASSLRAVLSSTTGRDDESIGHLTTEARAQWAADRERLLSLGNEAALSTIEDALFVVALEDLTPSSDLEACDQLLHGDSANRFFDKAVTFVVFADGRAGINVEHCELDGTTILAFVDAVLAASSTGVAQGEPAFWPVIFTLDDELRASIRSAAAEFAAYARATFTRAVTFTGFGSDRAKQLGMSPDAFVQAAYQLAHRRAKGLTGATYESIATRQYQNGRTEAMRVVTPEVLEFVAVLDDPEAGPEARAAAFRACAAAHVQRAKECQRGDAPEQHLWELQLIQKRRGAEVGVPEQPSLYSSPGWLIMRDDYLSTSSAPSTSLDYFGFGSTSGHCIGVGYVLLPDRLALYLSTPAAVAEGLESFAAELDRALGELAELLATT